MAQIEVSIKVRPLIGKEDSRLWVIPDENQLVQIDPKTHNHRGETYCFDHVFSERCNNAEVFNVVTKSIVEATVNGFNGTVFAYGQTSSGKTHTMRGSADDPGIIELAVEHLFRIMGQKRDREFLLKVSYIEIYNETINDLLNRENVNLKLKEEYGQVVIASVTEEITVSITSILALLERGEQNRRIAETCMNDRSSRSHAIFRLMIESKGIDDAVQVSQLNLVDLAGSEKTGQSGLTGSTFKEGCHINKSLTVLGKVINDLSENPDGFINYRDSKLTRILQTALGGNALTSIICTVAPATVDHTTSTLGFAQRAKKIKNKPKVNEILSKDAHIKRLHSQMAELQAEFEAFKGNRTKETETFNAEKLDTLKKLQDMLINGTVANSQTDSEMKQKAKRRQTWCDTKSFKQARKSVGALGSINQWALQSILEQDSISSSSTNDNGDCLSQYNGDRLDDFLTSPVNFGTPNPVSDFVNTRRGTGSRFLCTNIETPPVVLRERAETYLRDLQSLQELTELEKQINQEGLLEKLKLAEADNAKLKLELTNLERSRFEIEYEQGQKLEKAQRRVNELQGSLESAWSSQSGIESRSLLLETENKELLAKIELMNQMKESISEKPVETTADGQCGLSTGSDELDRHKQSLLKEIVALDPKLEITETADAEQLLTLLLSTVTTKQREFFANLSEAHDSKVNVLQDELNSLKQTIAKLEKVNVDLPESRQTDVSESSFDFESELALYMKQLDEKQETIAELNLKLTHAQELVSQFSEQIEILQRHDLLAEKDNQIKEIQEKLHAADEDIILKSQRISKLEEKITLTEKQLEENQTNVSEHHNNLSKTDDDSFQESMFVSNPLQVDTKLSLNDEILEQYSQQIADLEFKLALAEEENLLKQSRIDIFETEQLRISDKLKENDFVVTNLEPDQGAGVKLLECKLTEVEHLLQEKILMISQLEGRLSAISQEDSQQSQVTDLQARLAKMDNLLQEKILTISALEERLAVFNKEDSNNIQVSNINLQAKLAEMDNLLQEKMQTISELEGKLSAFSNENDSQLTQVSNLQAKLAEMDNLLQEKMQTISEMEGKLSAFSNENDSQLTQVSDLQAKLAEMDNLLQEKMQTISEMEGKLSAFNEENNSEQTQVDNLQAKLAEMDNLLQEKMQTISEMEGKLSAFNEENNSEQTQVDNLQAKINEMDNLLQEKMLAISELEGKLSAFNEENNSEQTQVDNLQAKLAEMDNLLQEKILTITEQEGKLSAFNEENDSQLTQVGDLQAKLAEMEHQLQEKILTITEQEEKLAAFNIEDSNNIQVSNIDLQAKINEMDNLLQEKMQTISELEGKLTALGEENDSHQTPVGNLQAKLAEMEQQLQEKIVTITEQEEKLAAFNKEDSNNIQASNIDLQAKLAEMDNLLQEKMQTISELEGKLTAFSEENDSHQTPVGDLQAKLAEMDNLLQEKILTITEQEEKLVAFNKEDSNNVQASNIDLQAKLAEMDNLLQEKILTITEQEEKLAAFNIEDSNNVQASNIDLQAKLDDIEHQLQEKILTITEQEGKLAAFNIEDSNNVQASNIDLQAKLDDIEHQLQEKILTITEQEGKLSAFNEENDSQLTQVSDLQAKLAEMDNLLQEKMLAIAEMEGKLSAFSNENDSQQTLVGNLQAKLAEVEQQLQEKILTIFELEERLSAISKEDSQGTQIGDLHAKLVDLEQMLLNKKETIDELESQLAKFSNETSRDSLFDELEVNCAQMGNSLQEKLPTFLEQESKLSNVNQFGDSTPEKSDNLEDCLVKLENSPAEISIQTSPISIEQKNTFSELQPDIVYLSESCTSHESESDGSRELSSEENIFETQANITSSVALVKTSESETQTEVCDLSNYDRNIIQVLENQLDKTRQGLACKLDEIQCMQASLTDKCQTIETLKEQYSKIDSEFKSLAENSMAVANKLHDTESELNAKNQSIAFLENKLQEYQVASEDLKESLCSSNTNFMKNVDTIKLLEDQLAKIRGSLKTSEEENTLLQKTLYEKAMLVEDLETKCNEQGVRSNEQSTRFQLLEAKLHSVETDLKNSLNDVTYLHDDLKEKNRFVDDLQSQLSQMQLLMDSLETKNIKADVELQQSVETIRCLEDERKRQLTEIQSAKEKLETLERAEMDMKVVHESDQITIDCLKEKSHSIESQLDEKSSAIDEITKKMENQQKSLEENVVVIQSLREQSECFENDLVVKLNEIKTLKDLIEDQSERLSENAFATQLLEEKLVSYEKNLENNLEKINETTGQLELQSNMLEERAKIILNLENILAERPNQEDVEKQLSVVCDLRQQLVNQEKTMKENAEANKVLSKQLEEAKKEAKNLDKENDYLEGLWREAEARESALETDIEKLKAELELATSSLDASKKDTELLQTTITNYESLLKDLSDQEKQFDALQLENKMLKENLEQLTREKQGLDQELEHLKRLPCECKNLKARVKTLLKEVERTNLQLVHRNGEYAKLEIQIMKEEYAQKTTADTFRGENADLKEKIKTLKAELQRMQADVQNRTLSVCPSCLVKPRDVAKSGQVELPLRVATAETAKLQENKSEEMLRQCTALQEKNQRYKRIAHDRMIYIVELEKDMVSLVPGFKPRVTRGENKENK